LTFILKPSRLYIYINIMTEIGIRPPQKETETKVDSPQETIAAPSSQAVDKPSIWSRMARPVVALFGATAIGGIGVAATQGGESDSNSRKAPDALAPAPQGYQAETPEQAAQAAATKTVLEQVTKEQQVKASKSEISEDEKRQRITAILEAEAPELLPLLEKGLPYYEENIQFGKPFRVISFVPENTMLGVPDLNQKLGEAINEHSFDALIQGLSIEKFQTDGKLDQAKSDRIQAELRGVKDITAIILPPTIDGADIPWAWGATKQQEPMLTAFLKHPLEKGKAVGKFVFHQDEVNNSSLFIRHHITGEQVNSGGGGGN
jgi:hypothetical protein